MTTTPSDLRNLRSLHSMLMEARDELSLELRDLERRMDAAEKELIPSGPQVEWVIREAIKAKWPHYDVNPSVKNVYDTFLVTLS